MHSPYFQSKHYAETPAGKAEMKVENFFYNLKNFKRYIDLKKFRKIRQKDCLTFLEFDQKYNIDTAHLIIDLPDGSGKKGPGIEVNSDKYPKSNGYQVCTLKHMDQVCNKLSKINNINNYEFIDIGSGKGKMLFYNILKKRPFSSYVGVEIDKYLHNDAISNLEKTNIEIDKEIKFINCDAFDYRPQPRETVYFLYRPFSPELHKDFFWKNKDTLTKSPTIIVLMCPFPGVIEFLVEKLNFKIHTEQFAYTILKN